MASATEPKVSTITAVSSLSAPVDIQRLFDHLNLAEGSDEGVVRIECGNEFNERATRGEDPRPPSMSRRRRTTSKRLFRNQTTALIRTKYGGDDTVGYINAKVFASGNLQMTGVKDVAQGRRAGDLLVRAIRSSKPTAGIVADVAALHHDSSKYRVCLIKCDFKVDMQIRRDLLFDLVVRTSPGVRCTFEPCVYPGVKINLPCGNVTISCFRSGCVIVTGAKTMQEVADARAFLVAFLATHRSSVEHFEPPRRTLISA